MIPLLFRLKKLLRATAQLSRVCPPSKPGDRAASVTISESHMPGASKQLRVHMRSDFAGRFSWSKLSRDFLVAAAVDPRTKVLIAYGLTRAEVSRLAFERKDRLGVPS